jgi:hypothetical protein
MRTLLATLMLCSFATSCGGDDDRPAECTAIFEACHKQDPGSGPIHECHEKAEEDWSQSECVANQTMCLGLCQGTADAAAGN